MKKVNFVLEIMEFCIGITEKAIGIIRDIGGGLKEEGVQEEMVKEVLQGIEKNKAFI